MCGLQLRQFWHAKKGDLDRISAPVLAAESPDEDEILSFELESNAPKRDVKSHLRIPMLPRADS
jgi:hypothetical protein